MNGIGPHRHHWFPVGQTTRECSLCPVRQVKVAGRWKPVSAEARALDAESRIQGAATQDEREMWQRTADYYWSQAS